jgi:dGTP triphosphohydrolase
MVQHGQQRIMRELFRFYYDRSERDPKKGGDRRVFPPGAKRVLDDGPNEASDRARVVVDYLSGLTETVAGELHRRLVGGSAPTLDATAHTG